MKPISRLLPLLFLACFVFVSCKKDDSHIERVNDEIYELMRDVYLWYDHLPPQPDPGAYRTPQAYMEALRYAQYDQWSYVTTVEDNQQYFEEGKDLGYAFSLGLDDNDNVRILFVYRFSEVATKGIKRGWILSKINGINTPPNNSLFDLMGDDVAGVQNALTFIDEYGATHEITLTKEIYDITPVLHYEVITQGINKIGYVVFQDFISTASEEISEAMQYFVASGINELIIDLRYNGGGMVSVATDFAGWLIGKNYSGQPFVHYEFNDKNTDANKVLNIPVNNNGLVLDRVFFIGTEYTASASEMLIYGLRPYISNVILAGTTTHGKPVGMYGWEISEYMVYPICFSYYNKNHEGDFFDGIAPALVAADDRTRDFGDPDEASLKAVLDYIQSGSLPLKSVLRTTASSGRILEPKRSMRQYIRAY